MSEPNEFVLNKPLFAVSLGTLMVLPVVLHWWLLMGTPFDRSFLSYNYGYYDSHYTHLDVMALAAMASAVAAVSYACLRFGGRWSRAVVNVLVLLAFLLLANVIRADVTHMPSVRFVRENWAVAGVVTLVVGFIFIRYFDPLMRLSRVVVVVLSPISALLAINLAWGGYQLMPADAGLFTADRPLVAAGGLGRVRGRVIWLVFDELDFRLPFERDLPGVELGNLRRLRREAFFATDAHPPQNMTYLSMPSLTTGAVVSKNAELRHWDYELTRAADGAKSSWRSSPNIFAAARKIGARVAIMAEYQTPPYCSLFHAEATVCWQQGLPWPEHLSVVGQVQRMALELFKTFPRMRFVVDRKMRRHHPGYHADRHIRFVDAVGDAVADPNLDFVFVHLGVPHLPNYYDRDSNRYLTDPAFDDDNYLDNLELADKTLGQIREALEKSGTWETSNVIVSADHSCRDGFCKILDVMNLKQDHRVPFIVKLAGQRKPLVHSRRMETLRTERLIRHLLNCPIGARDIPVLLAAGDGVADRPGRHCRDLGARPDAAMRGGTTRRSNGRSQGHQILIQAARAMQD